MSFASGWFQRSEALPLLQFGVFRELPIGSQGT